MSSILYIEDDSNNRVLVSRVFKAMAPDFTYLEAATAQAGIALALDRKPDLILMDISMPDMDGLTATGRIRQMANIKQVPIIALTANAMDGDRERFIAAGCDGYISKPIDIDTFVDTVRTFLKPALPEVTVPDEAASEVKPASSEAAPAAPEITPAVAVEEPKVLETPEAQSTDSLPAEEPKVLESSKDGGAV